MNKGQLYLISAPSGAGKTSIVHELIKNDKKIRLAVSHTTRAPRTGEEHGKDYYFISGTEFADLLKQNTFLEHANVYNNFYGTSKIAVFAMLNTGADVILEIDWQGARQVMAQLPDTVHISIAPPSIEALKSRLGARGQDSRDVIADRMRQARDEVMHLGEAKYIVINDDFARALRSVHSIFIAERQRADRQSHIVDKLLNRHKGT